MAHKKSFAEAFSSEGCVALVSDLARSLTQKQPNLRSLRLSGLPQNCTEASNCFCWIWNCVFVVFGRSWKIFHQFSYDHGTRTTTLEAGIWWLWNVVNLNCLVTFFLLQEWVDWKCIKKRHLVRHVQALKERQANVGTLRLRCKAIAAVLELVTWRQTEMWKCKKLSFVRT